MKIIFLDVDGVLNDAWHALQLDEFRIELLARLVNETNAQIVLSSNWRQVYVQYKRKERMQPEQKKALKNLLRLLKKHSLSILSYTPTIGYGPDSRPLEIKRWLRMHPEVDSYVILDDEFFWNWSDLSEHVVLTSETINEEWKAGLENKHIDKAINILKGID